MSDLIKEAKERLELSKVYGTYDVDTMATVACHRAAGIIVQVNPVDYRIGNEYFKVFSGKSYYASKKMARISFWKPVYITSSTNYGREAWVLNAQDKKALVKLLKADSIGGFTLDGSRKLTNWERAIVCYNEEMHHSQDETEANLLGTSSYNRQFLPFNLPMPNYLEL